MDLFTLHLVYVFMCMPLYVFLETKESFLIFFSLFCETGLWLKNTSVVLLSLQIGELILNMLTVGTLSMCHDMNRFAAMVSATT